jgi:hypothetical protein
MGPCESGIGGRPDVHEEHARKKQEACNKTLTRSPGVGVLVHPVRPVHEIPGCQSRRKLERVRVWEMEGAGRDTGRGLGTWHKNRNRQYDPCDAVALP